MKLAVICCALSLALGAALARPPPTGPVSDMDVRVSAQRAAMDAGAKAVTCRPHALPKNPLTCSGLACVECCCDGTVRVHGSRPVPPPPCPVCRDGGQ